MIIRNYPFKDPEVEEYICTRKMIVKLGTQGDCFQILTDCKSEEIFEKFILELAERIKRKNEQKSA